jgi:hypothetical protein
VGACHLDIALKNADFRLGQGLYSSFDGIFAGNLYLGKRRNAQRAPKSGRGTA